MLGDTPNRVVSNLRITTRRLKLEPDPEYPTDRKRWITDKFNPTRDKFNDKIEESETIYLNYRNKTKAVFFSQEGSFKGLGGLTYSIDLMDPEYAEII